MSWAIEFVVFLWKLAEYVEFRSSTEIVQFVKKLLKTNLFIYQFTSGTLKKVTK